MFTVSSCFIWNFKLGDNINHNLEVLKQLYRYFNQAEAREKKLLYKPIILILVSITEALLYDFHERIQKFAQEGVINLTGSIIDYIRGKQIDELEKYIASAKRHDLFDAKDTNFYDRLHELRRLRNRIHIQNTKNDFEPDEINAFTEARMVSAEKVLERALKTLAKKYPRKPELKYVRDFELPWKEHFPRK